MANNDLISRTAAIAGVEQWAHPEYDVIYCSELDLSSLRWWPYWERCGAKMDGGETNGAVAKLENAG